MAPNEARLSRHTDYTDPDADRPVWAALASIPTPAVLRSGAGNNAVPMEDANSDNYMEWIAAVEDAILNIQIADPRNLILVAYVWGYSVLDDGAPIPVEVVAFRDPAVTFVGGILRGEIHDGKHPDVWLIQTDDGVWLTLMDNTGMGMVAGEALGTDGAVYGVIESPSGLGGRVLLHGAP